MSAILKNAFGLVLMLCLIASCGGRDETSRELPSMNDQASVRGYQFRRVTTHFHSPYSFDACDGKGYVNGQLDEGCLQDARRGLCLNRVDAVFVTDHANHMAKVPFDSLFLKRDQDQDVVESSVKVANRIQCDDSHDTLWVPGLEGKILAMGMTQHVTGLDESALEDLYNAEDATSVSTIQTETQGLIAIPHTESRNQAQMIAANPALIEMYNVHANLDPKIRKAHLDLKPFEHIAKFLNYIIDPFGELNPDFLFLEFIEWNHKYFDQWNSLLSSGFFVGGIGGLDSHQNVFKQKGSDGERLDSHRRMTRFMNNWVLSEDRTVSSIKASLSARRSFLVIEGLGTPMNLDFYAESSLGQVIEVGGHLSLTAGESAYFTVKIPGIHPDAVGMNDSVESPILVAEMIRIDPTSGQESVVYRQESRGFFEFTFPVSIAGFYRLKIQMVPKHIRRFLFDQDLADRLTPWIQSNPIRVTL